MVVLVDSKDRPVGRAQKMEAHRNGWLHRAVSVLLFDTQGRMLLQRRAWCKYHSPGLWANACCAHPLPEEFPHKAALRRLRQEMGIFAPLTAQGSFLYRADVGGGLTEHEYDHIFTGFSDELPVADAQEVMDYAYATVAELGQDIENHPQRYAPWFRIIFTTFNWQIELWAQQP
ncbi:MAG: isopentenyl-diphosphate Delta-isomerase [Rikenellaceae bacterium]|nr:isopentenyl-diphosphate Delta-isomerase [Rikenellaceae bacterium]